MQMPVELDLHTSWRREALLREAEADRLARSVAITRTPWLRARVAGALYALAVRLDPCATIAIIDRTRVEARSA